MRPFEDGVEHPDLPRRAVVVSQHRDGFVDLRPSPPPDPPQPRKLLRLVIFPLIVLVLLLVLVLDLLFGRRLSHRRRRRLGLLVLAEQSFSRSSFRPP